MSVKQFGGVQFQYRWCPPVMKWYRHATILLISLGIILVALWSLEQGNGPYVILGVFGMMCVTVMAIFGVEMEGIHVSLFGGKVQVDIPFSNTTDDSDE